MTRPPMDRDTVERVATLAAATKELAEAAASFAQFVGGSGTLDRAAEAVAARVIEMVGEPEKEGEADA